MRHLRSRGERYDRRSSARAEVPGAPHEAREASALATPRTADLSDIRFLRRVHRAEPVPFVKDGRVQQDRVVYLPVETKSESLGFLANRFP